MGQSRGCKAAQVQRKRAQVEVEVGCRQVEVEVIKGASGGGGGGASKCRSQRYSQPTAEDGEGQRFEAKRADGRLSAGNQAPAGSSRKVRGARRHAWRPRLIVAFQQRRQ
jgi:hypothetical protein